MEGLKLDFRSTEPLYQQLEKALLQEIESSEYKPDDQFLTEREIVERFNVSKITAKGALNSLVYKDILYLIYVLKNQELFTFKSI